MGTDWFRRTLKSPVEKAILESFVSIETDLFSAQQAKIDAPLQNFTDNQSKNKIANQVRKADPEETKTLRERANLQHRLLVALLSKKLKANDIEPKFNTFIDLCCDSPQKLLFEVKSCNSENQLEQIRKAISQLYEYRYRHSDMKDSTLVLALEEKPKMDWMVDYLVTDRNISLCWLEGEENLACPKACQEKLSLLVDRTEG